MKLEDLKAINNFNDKKHIYLEVVGSGEGQHLEAREKQWFGRLWMWLGFSNASMNKVMKYLVTHCNEANLVRRESSSGVVKYEFRNKSEDAFKNDIIPEKKCILKGKISHFLTHHSLVKKIQYQGISNLLAVWPNENKDASIEEGLTKWAGADLERNIAVRKIRQAFYDSTGVTTLWLEGLNLTSLPDEICKLEKLQTLHLRGNKLTHLPKDFVKLENLTHLFLDRNNLTHLPEDIGKLENLLSLGIKNNNLKALPEDIVKLSKLMFIQLDIDKVNNYSAILDQMPTVKVNH
jgi:hypothetical protein